MTKLEPFFTTQEPYETEDSESGDSDINEGFSSEEDDFEGLKASTKVVGNDEKAKVDKGMSPILHEQSVVEEMYTTAWFKQPKGMSNWLYKYFKEEIGPILFQKQGSYLVEPTLFSDNQSAAPTFWVQPPEPTIYLAQHRFTPTLYYRPHVFLWLPHFLISKLYCPQCRTAHVLEKNGALQPRCVVDTSNVDKKMFSPGFRRM